MTIRQIEESDLAQVQSLLCEGFPRRTATYWQHALDILTARPAPLADLPRYGFLIDTDGRLDGVLLTIASERDGQVFCNLSSWYVRAGQRASSIFLLRRALRSRDVTYTDISPVGAIVEMIGKLGFIAHTGGAALLTPAQLLLSGSVEVKPLTADVLDHLPSTTRVCLQSHMDIGCVGLAIGTEAALYRVGQLKRLPCAYFVSGKPEVLIAAAGPLMRYLARRGLGLALLDLPQGAPPAHGLHLPRRNVRYATSDTPPAVGDLLDTELALFGP